MSEEYECKDKGFITAKATTIIQEEILSIMHDKIDRRDSFRENIYPMSFIFERDTKNLFDEIVLLLKNNGINAINVNEFVSIKPEDYNIKLKEIGFRDADDLTINDLLYEKDKRNTVLSQKLDLLRQTIDDNTVLIIYYNDLFLDDHATYFNGSYNQLYESIRYMLKEGVDSEKLLMTLIFLEREDKITDFCPGESAFFSKNNLDI